MPTDEETSPVFPSAIRRAYDLLLAGVSPGSIAGTWNAAGLPAGPDGGPTSIGRRGTWTADRVRAVLADPGYAGGLVDEPTWHSATALLSVPPRRGPVGADRALLTAIASCGPCGQPVQSVVVSPGQEETGIFHMPGGQSGNPLSPYYQKGIDAWQEGKATPFLLIDSGDIGGSLVTAIFSL